MTTEWKPTQERLPNRITSTQTKTKMPYSNSPIIRARIICETKAMAALKMRTVKATSAIRRAVFFMSAPVRIATIAPSTADRRCLSANGSIRPAV